MSNPKKAYLFGLLTVFIWSTVASAFKLTLVYISPLELLFYSCLTSTCVLFASAYLNTKGFIFILKKEIFKSAWLGFINPFCYYLVLFKAYDLLPAQEAQPLNYTWGITLSLLSIPLLKQKISFHQLGAILLSYFGVLIISTHGHIFSLHFTNPLGVGLALFSTILWALYWIFNTKDTLNPSLRLFYNFLFGSIYISIYFLLTKTSPTFNLKGFLGAFYVGLFEMGITFILWLKALKYAQNTAQVSNLIYLSPFLSLIFIHFLVGEKILFSTYIGLIFILAGLIYQNQATQKL
ncbi:Permease of the drug/metabolite transporter (DMT) superfamily [Desulfonauticus submarinus]|uniref:Permease of the drug/metabolite transporter (DMT) superfamily n=1 Tax=Desulfonauticus submarinus TaxID=206665 RepID=A0A1H0AES5_9BACT|nr:DMT family transporter [Desulfonauticus submarinus]SDN32122.1 Permease of the drug/metabolite transporter (DMT) superfamily [Desulfonauticus submarinus]